MSRNLTSWRLFDNDFNLLLQPLIYFSLNVKLCLNRPWNQPVSYKQRIKKQRELLMGFNHNGMNTKCARHCTCDDTPPLLA